MTRRVKFGKKSLYNEEGSTNPKKALYVKELRQFGNSKKTIKKEKRITYISIKSCVHLPPNTTRTVNTGKLKNDDNKERDDLNAAATHK